MIEFERVTDTADTRRVMVLNTDAIARIEAVPTDAAQTRIVLKTGVVIVAAHRDEDMRQLVIRARSGVASLL